MKYLVLFLALFAAVANGNNDPQCRGITGDNGSHVIGTADVVLIGSGPAGAGFLHRLVRIRPDLSVIWIEKGQDFKALNWPEQITDVDVEVLTNIPRKKLKHIAGKAWNNFGGGDAANSGGANYLVSDEPYDPVDVFELRNHSIIPPTKTSERWVKAFESTGFKEGPPPPIKTDDKDIVSQPSSLRTEDGRNRLLLADDLRYSTENRKVTYAHARAASVIREGNTGRAIGVRGVRIDHAQDEYGGCVAWKANLAVVLAGGVFNTFDLLVETGIGPEKYLKVREVPEDWWTPNEDVGKGVGDEHSVVFVGAEPETADPYGAQPRLIAEDTNGSAYEFWTKGLKTWLMVRTHKNYVFWTGLRFVSKPIVKFVGWFLQGSSMWAIGVFSDPIIELEAIAKFRNNTWSPWGKFNYNKNKLGIIIDDSKITATDKMCKAINRSMKPMKDGGRLQNKVKAGVGTRNRRRLLWLATKTGIVNIVKPNLATFWNADKFTGKGCSTDMFASYYHYYGGNAKVVDDSYQVKGTPGLLISDASVLERLVAGPTSATSMQTGMRVADSFVASLGDDS